MTACLGGWCAVRENFKHYHVEGPLRLRPIERLCEPATHTAFQSVPHDAFESARNAIPIAEAA